MIILLDMDGCLADFDKYLVEQCRQHSFWSLIIAIQTRNTMKLQDAEFNRMINWFMTRPGFFYNLSVIDGCIDAIKEMVDEGHQVIICTTPLGPSCVSEKYQWIEDKLGAEYIHHIVMTTDKTIIHGDYLIDDNHQITGCIKPSWKQILFDRPYNREDSSLVRMKNWSEWRKFIGH